MTNEFDLYIAAREKLVAEALQASKKRLNEVQARILSDLNDPLQSPVETVRDLVFSSDGKLNRSSIKKTITQWKDSDGNIVYTQETYLPLVQIRGLRDRVVMQQAMFGAFSPEQQTQMRAGYTSSTAKMGGGICSISGLFSLRCIGNEIYSTETKSSETF